MSRRLTAWILLVGLVLAACASGGQPTLVI